MRSARSPPAGCGSATTCRSASGPPEARSPTISLTVIFGTRPEAIKLGPVVAELRAGGVEPTIICTGQHTTLLRGTPAETDLRNAQSLGVVSEGNVEDWLELSSPVLEAALADDPYVVVQGDTMSALAGARAARARDLNICHVEAGVRSGNLEEPWPEELARIEIAAMATWHYTPTSTTYANLIREGVSSTRIRLTGNTGISALARYSPAKPVPPTAQVLITLHRREWRDGRNFIPVLEALAFAAGDNGRITFRWPVHPAVHSSLPAGWRADLPANFVLESPLTYAQATYELSRSMGVLTDSGGLQEEAAALGVPCVVLRGVTDRPESIDAGIAVLHPPTADGVMAGVDALCRGTLPRRPSDCFGDITAASRVARHLIALLGD